MSETSLFRQYAEEALHESAKAADREGRRALENLACTWAKAAVASDHIFGSPPKSGPHGVKD